MASSLYIYDDSVYYYFLLLFKYTAPHPPLFWRFTLENRVGGSKFPAPHSPPSPAAAGRWR